MINEEERPEDALRRIAQRCVELEAWQQKYREAAELWDALELDDNQQVTQAVMDRPSGTDRDRKNHEHSDSDYQEGRR